MEVFRIQGGRDLAGQIRVSGAKNAALPIFSSCLLTAEPCRIENVPDLSDIRFMAEILRFLGARVERVEPGVWEIEAARISNHAPYELVRKMRASICLMGALVGRLGSAEISLPGGCVIGPRPIDLHLKGLQRMGCVISSEAGYVKVDGSAMRGRAVFLGGRHGSTVTGTANLLMAAVRAPGQTRIDSAACEPEITDLCRHLIGMGAKIEGVGSPTLLVEGVETLGGHSHRILPDRIEAGTYLLASAMMDSEIVVEDVRPEHLSALLDKLDEAGYEINAPHPRSLSVRCRDRRLPVDVITLPHPGFPTDLQAQMCALMSQTPGISILTERIYPHRFMHVPELQRMGADIAIEGPSAIVKGAARSLSGAPVMASDLRASAALVLAGLAARGETWIQRIYHLDRGYERVDEKLRGLGAELERLPAGEMPKELRDDSA